MIDELVKKLLKSDEFEDLFVHLMSMKLREWMEDAHIDALREGEDAQELREAFRQVHNYIVPPDRFL